MLVFLLISFIRFHRRNKWRYQERKCQNNTTEIDDIGTNKRLSVSYNRVRVSDVVNSCLLGTDIQEGHEGWKEKLKTHKWTKDDIENHSVEIGLIEAAQGVYALASPEPMNAETVTSAL